MSEFRLLIDGKLVDDADTLDEIARAIGVIRYFAKLDLPPEVLNEDSAQKEGSIRAERRPAERCCCVRQTGQGRRCNGYFTINSEVEACLTRIAIPAAGTSPVISIM
jgi:hypothetical protein